jgi:hypothetical protein
MNEPRTTSCTAFAGSRRIAKGDLQQVALKAKAFTNRGPWAQVLIFDDVTSQLIEVDFRGTLEEVAERITGERSASAQSSESPQPAEEARRPGRPKLGVVPREVTLLPRHWDWLASQPGGASVALRKLVEHARKANQGKDRQRQAQEAAYRFLSAMAGNEPGFEEAARALFASKRKRFAKTVESWPKDVRDHAKRLATVAFDASGSMDAEAD